MVDSTGVGKATGPAAEIRAMVTGELLKAVDGREWWKVLGDVWVAQSDGPKNGDGLPVGLRWECTVAAWPLHPINRV